MDRKGLGVSARRGMMTTPRIHSFFPKLSLASVHKYLRIRDLCKELAFGSQHAGGECRSSYNSFEFNVLCRQFLESVHKCLRICDLCKELGILVCTRILQVERERQAKTDACLVPLCPLASMVPVFWR